MQDEQQPVATPAVETPDVNEEQVEALATTETLEQQLATERRARQEAEDKNRKLFERAKQAEAKFYETKKQLGGPAETGVTPDDVDMAYLAARGYSDDEINSLKVLARGTGKRLRDAASLPEAKPIIDWKRAQTKSEQATPPASNRVMVQQQTGDPKSNFDRTVAKYTKRAGNRGNE